MLNCTELTQGKSVWEMLKFLSLYIVLICHWYYILQTQCSQCDPVGKLAQTGPKSLVHVWMAKDKWLLQFLLKKTSGELLFNRTVECAGAVEAGLGCLSLKSRQSVLNVHFIWLWVLARGQVSPFPVFLDHTCPLPATRGTWVGWEKPTSLIFKFSKQKHC